MKYESFDEARLMDSLLFEMAMYDVTNGLIPIIESKEDYQKLYVQVSRRFNQFKKWIQLGESNFEAIRDSVLSRNGPYVQKQKTDEQVIDELIHPPKMTEEDTKQAITTMEQMIDILRKSAIKKSMEDEIDGIDEADEGEGEEDEV